MYEWDNTGKLIKREIDQFNDGSIERVLHVSYNVAGQKFKLEEDTNNNGDIDEVTT